MFRKRLTWFWILLIGVAVVLVGRLVDIQVLRAAEYEELAARLLAPSVEYLRAPRGRILDRHGRVLVSHEPSYDISIHYAVLTGQSRSYLRKVAWRLRKLGEYPDSMSLDDIATQLRLQIADMWQRLSALTGHPLSEFLERGERIRDQVARIRAGVRQRTGIDRPVKEENWLHPLIEDVNDEAALAVRLELEQYPWLSVVPSSRRVAHEADAVVHLLGRLGAVSPERLEQDPLDGDPLYELHPGDRCGITGVECLAETTLRGIRGRIVKEVDGTELERLNPIIGDDVTLTIDMELQESVLGLLAEAIDGQDQDGKPRLTWPAGGAAVVIDVATREVLALVSYPVYHHDSFSDDYERLIRDAKRLPTRFRAVNGLYPPGSTCKVITLVGALTDGVTSEHERIHCTGHLLPGKPNMFRCWIYNQFQTTHDITRNPDGLNAAEAICNSCNIYFFKMGGRLGPQRLCEWFTRFGFGRLQGTGLIEESPGLVPTEGRIRRSYQKSDAWNFSIGQGEVNATPLQVANVCATIASGYWAPVRLVREMESTDGDPFDLERTEFEPDVMRILRSGMWCVVNDRRGTAYRRARLDRKDYVLCGKTGSAQAPPRSVTYRYTFEWPDGRRENVEAYLEADALQRFEGEKPKRVGKHTVKRYPVLPSGELSAHAWFMGYTQPATTPVGEAPTEQVYAIAVVVEYGLSGSRAAGPVAKKIAEWVVENYE